MVNLFERIFHRAELREGRWLLKRMQEERDDMRVALICERNTAAFLRGAFKEQVRARLKAQHRRADEDAVKVEMAILLGE